MKVTDNSTELLDYSKKLDNKLRNETIKKETEIDNLKKIYEKKIDATKVEGEDNYVNSIKRNDDLLVGASKNYEDKLNNYRENLEKTQKSISQEENSLKSDHNQKMEGFKDQYLSNMHEQFKSANDNQEALHQETQNNLQTITDKSRAEKIHLDTTARAEINALSSEYNQKGVSTEREYRATLDNDLRAHQADINLQKTELKKVMDKTTEQNKRLETEKAKVQTDELTYLDLHQKDILSQKQSDFKVRYENLVKEHETLLTELKTHFAADVKKMVEQNAGQKRIIANRSDDQFYRVETLKPTIVENVKEYVVSIAVPEHEKENVHLSVHGRGVKMTLTRKYTESMDDKDGSTNRSTRNELYSKEFPSKDILNPKQVVQKYEDGVLTYKIQKL
ncbi:MAG: Hsp20 family protein [Bacteriovorax sp.]|nr:Hsp20 family protein [Bacteriovorax sp.]